MAQLDEGVEKLQQFCTLLAEVNSQVTEDINALEAAGGDLERLEDTVEAAFDGLGAELSEGLEETAHGARDAVEGVTGVGDAARSGADSVLDEAEGDLDEAEEGFRSKLTSETGALDDHLSDLKADGFEVLEGGLEETRTELQKAGGEAESAFQELATNVEALEPELSGARNDAAGALQGAAGAFANQTDGLESEAPTARQAWAKAADDFAAECQGHAQPLQAAYGALQSGGEAAGDDLMTFVESEASEAATELGDGVGNDLETAGEAATGDTLPALEGALSTSAQALGAVAAGIESLAELVEELDVSERVADQIDKALSALE